MSGPIDPQTGRTKLGGRALSADQADCEHAWTPLGFLGPYPTEACPWCNTAAILPTPGHPHPLTVLLDALTAAGCEPHLNDRDGT